MASPAFCSNCGRPLAAGMPCATCAVPAYDSPVTPAVSAPAPSEARHEGQLLPTAIPPRASSGAYDGGAYAGSANAYGGNAYGGGAYAGTTTGVPELSRYTGMWNWGAFLLCPFWLMNHGAVPLGIVALLLSFVPLVNFFSSLGFGIYFGIKGNEWAASHRTFTSDAQFVAVQNAWRNWGIGLAILGIALSFASFVLIGVAHALVHAATR